MARSTRNPYAIPDDAVDVATLEPFQAPAPDVEVIETVPAPQPEPEPAKSKYPVVYYNPKVIDEQFYIVGSPYRKRFVNGRFVATDEVEEAAVRACLAAWGKEKPDRWKGDDRKRAWTDAKTGFTTLNDNAKYDFEYFHEN